MNAPSETRGSRAGSADVGMEEAAVQATGGAAPRTSSDELGAAPLRVLFWGDDEDDACAVALADLEAVGRVAIERVGDREALTARLARPGFGPIAPLTVVVAGPRAAAAVLLPRLAAATPEQALPTLLVFHRDAHAALGPPPDRQVVLLDAERPPSERLQLLRLTFDHARLGRALAVARTERVLRPALGARVAPRRGWDGLTGLPDRAGLRQRLEEELARLGEVPGYRFALLTMNINRFKVVNDSFGHEHADALLAEMGRRLRRTVRQSDFVARVGGDEFAIVLSGMPAAWEADAVARRLIADPLTVTAPDGRALPITVAVGGVIARPEAPPTLTDLLRKASLALVDAKARGGARVAFFDPEAHARDLAERDLEPQILRGLRDDEFCLYHQPILRLSDQRIVGFEALIRWQHPELGLVPPSAFIPMLETSGLIHPMGEWIVARACADLAAFDRAGAPADLFLNLNVSHRQLLAPGFAALALAEIERAGVNPRRLAIELTETTVIDDFAAVTANIEALRAAGVRIFIDDFGVGYSSLASLSHLPVDALKIDRSFVRDMVSSPRSAALVGKIVDIGHLFELPLVAEGVETAEEHRAVLAAGCDLVQGYRFARPLPLEEAIARVTVAPPAAVDAPPTAR